MSSINTMSRIPARCRAADDAGLEGGADWARSRSRTPVDGAAAAGSKSGAKSASSPAMAAKPFHVTGWANIAASRVRASSREHLSGKILIIVR
jgi:hypothetical protein